MNNLISRENLCTAQKEINMPSLESIKKTTSLSPKTTLSKDALSEITQDLTPYTEKLSTENVIQPLEEVNFPNQPRPGSSKLPSTIANLKHLLSRYGVTVKYNVIKKKVEVIVKGHTGSIDNMDEVLMIHIISLAALNGMSVGQIPAYLAAIANANPYNPIVEWILSKPWDGQDRLPEIAATVTAREDYPEHLKVLLIRKWLLSAVAAVMMPSGFRARGVLTFQGPQGVGKTSWIMSLVPDELLRDQTVKVDHHFDSSKDSIIGAVTHWLVEIGELDGSFRKDIAKLKGFLTSGFDKLRRPYARTESEYQRRTVFFASVNKPDFLVDDTGNSRWWTIPVTKINYKHDVDMQQVFAQLAVDVNNGKEWWLNEHEEALLNLHNNDHRSTSAIRERLMEIVDPELVGMDGNPAMSASEVLRKLGYERYMNPQCKECGGILRELYGAPKKINGTYKWRIPLRRSPDPYTSIDDDNVY
ncbi:MAG: VapE domain-containing protein [Thermodesulfobacteriota bacterium]